MNLFELLLRVSLLLQTTLIGYFLGKKFLINSKDISNILLYVISPIVVFISVIQSPNNDSYILYSLVAFISCCILATLALYIGKFLWKDNTKNLFAFTCGTGNTGYFGLPLAIGILGTEGAAIAIFIILGVNFYEFSYGYYLTSRGNFSIYKSVLKIISMPIIYAFLLAFLAKTIRFHPHTIIVDYLNNFKGAYSILGMMVIGITLSKFQNFKVDWKFVIASLGWKYIVWPIVGGILIYLFDIKNNTVQYSAIILMSCVPMAGNTVVIANTLDLHPEKAATAVIISTIFAVLIIPIALILT